jgi:hypothetical protein
MQTCAGREKLRAGLRRCQNPYGKGQTSEKAQYSSGSGTYKEALTNTKIVIFKENYL